MSGEGFHARLAECDRTILDLQYSFSEASDIYQILLKQKAELEAQSISLVEIDERFAFLDEQLLLTQYLLEKVRHNIKIWLAMRTCIEQLNASDSD